MYEACINSVVTRDPTWLVVNNDDSSPDNINTTNSMDIGDTFDWSLQQIGDWDWIEITL